jgi:hypothetical protein
VWFGRCVWKFKNNPHKFSGYLPWIWWQESLKKCWYPFTKSHNATFQKNIIFVFTAMRSSNVRIVVDVCLLNYLLMSFQLHRFQTLNKKLSVDCEWWIQKNMTNGILVNKHKTWQNKLHNIFIARRVKKYFVITIILKFKLCFCMRCYSLCVMER